MFSEISVSGDSPSETIGADGHSGQISVADALLLLTATCRKTGTDLVLTGSDGKKLVIPDYFKSSILPDLISTDGTVLSAASIEHMVGHSASGGRHVIGHVEGIVGTVTVQHANGVVETLSLGDAILHGDVIQTESDGAIRIGLTSGGFQDVPANAHWASNDFSQVASIDESQTIQPSTEILKANVAVTAEDTAPPGDTPSHDIQPDSQGLPRTNTPNPLLDTHLPVTEKFKPLLPFDDPSFASNTSVSQVSSTVSDGSTAPQLPSDVAAPFTQFAFASSVSSPVAVADFFATTLGHTLHVSARGVLANDTGFNGTALTAGLTLDTLDGLLTLRADGSFDYRPYFHGTTTFTYIANDGVSGSNPATVTINVAKGPDTFDLSSATASTLVMLDKGIAFNADFGLQWLTGFNHVIGGLGNDTLIGNNSGNVLNGGAGHDVIVGGSGDDILIGDTGNDNLAGGLGDDTFVFRPGFGYDIIWDFQIGNALHHDSLDLRGLGFTSTLDILNHTTDAGPDSIIQVGNDIIMLAGITKAAFAAGIDNVTIGGSYSGGSVITIIGGGTVPIYGTGADDGFNATLGNALHVTGYGVLANDTGFNDGSATASLNTDTIDGLLSLNSNGSFDFLPYFAGTTSFTYVANNGATTSNPATVTIEVAKGTDTFDISWANSDTLVMLDANSGIAFNAQAGLLRLQNVDHVISGSGDDTIVGNNNGGLLNGGAGNDIIQGGAGRDVLIGAAGNDTLTGGAGDDIFVFRSGFGHDTVTDFSVGDPAHFDVLDLRGLGFASVLDVFNNTDAGSDAVIHAGADDITLVGIDKALLALHQSAILV